MKYGTSRIASSEAAPPRTAPVCTCPMCNSASSTLLFKAVDRLHGTPGEFSYRKCGACRTVYQDPRVIPEDLSRCYPENYYTHEILHQLDPTPVATLLAQRRTDSRVRVRIEELRRAIIVEVGGQKTPSCSGMLARLMAKNRRLRERAFFDRAPDDLLVRTPQSPRALDIGCGAGHNLVILQRAGWDVEGVEWDSGAAAVARRVSGRHVHAGDFRKLDLPPNSFGLILMNHVLEHIDRPVDALRRIGQLLTVDGRAIVRYPNPRSLGAWLFKTSWFPWEVPRHLVLPPLAALIAAANEVGLTAVDWGTENVNAARFSAMSRSIRNGQPVIEFCPTIARRDRWIGLVEGMLVRSGLEVGEEAKVVLRKAPTAD